MSWRTTTGAAPGVHSAQDPLEPQVLERLGRDRRREIGGVGEIHRRLAAGHGRLLEENLLIRPVVGAPVTDAALQGPQAGPAGIDPGTAHTTTRTP